MSAAALGPRLARRLIRCPPLGAPRRRQRGLYTEVITAVASEAESWAAVANATHAGSSSRALSDYAASQAGTPAAAAAAMSSEAAASAAAAAQYGAVDYKAAQVAVAMGAVAMHVPLVGPGLVQFLQFSPPLAGQALFLSPMTAMSGFRANKSTGKISVLPYAAMTANGLAWTTYGALGGDLTIMLPNASGFVLGLYYCRTFHVYRSAEAVTTPYFAGASLFCAGVGFAVAALPAATAKLVIGYAGVAVCTVMFYGPLASIKTVLADRSATSIPLAFTAASTANCTLWTAYGLLVIHDPFVWGPNGVGLACSIAQLALIGKFGSGPPDKLAVEARLRDGGKCAVTESARRTSRAVKRAKEAAAAREREALEQSRGSGSG